MTPPDLSLLSADGDWIPVPGSPSLRITLRLDHDPDASLNDYERDGFISPAYSYHDPESQRRPARFTDAALRIPISRSEMVWWEPYDNLYGYPDEDGVYRSAALWDDLPPHIRDREINRITTLLQDGYLIATLSLTERLHDSLGNVHHVTLAESSCGAIESVYPELIEDLASELPIPLPISAQT